MNMDTTINLWNTVFTGLTFISASVAAFFAYKIGIKQNEINKQALDIANFVEIFVQPQQKVVQDNEKNQQISWNLIIQNASSYPIYINDYTLNGVKHSIGNTVLPNNSNQWYTVSIPTDIQNKGEFSLIISFEDYLGNKYQSESFGEFRNYGWNIRSQKRRAL